MNTFSPHERFLMNHDATTRAEFSRLMSTRMIQDAMKDTLAQMAFRGNTAEQLSGARQFIEWLINFSEPEEQPKQLPVKSLKT